MGQKPCFQLDHFTGAAVLVLPQMMQPWNRRIIQQIVDVAGPCLGRDRRRGHQEDHLFSAFVSRPFGRAQVYDVFQR